MICKLKECGTAFSLWLAIQFSKTEHHSLEPGRPLPLRALTTAASRRPRSVKEGGFYLSRLAFVKRKFRGLFSKPLPTRGRPYLLRPFSLVNPFVERFRLRSTVWVPATEGASNLLPAARQAEPRQPATSLCLFGATAGSFYRPHRAAVKCTAKVDRESTQRRAVAQLPTSADAFRQRLARALAASSIRPPLRERSWMAIASRAAAAFSSSSFTTTYA